MLTHLLKRAIRALGFEVRRVRDPELPFVHEIRCDDGRFHLWIANEHTRNWWHKSRLHLNAEFRMLRELCTPGSVVLDVGAHHGMHTILLSRWAGRDGHVHAFEPNPENALVLYANVALNRLSNCTCVRSAVGSRTGTLTMNGESVAPSNGAGKQVRLVTLDDYCAELGLGRIDLLKIDVEGFESEVLEGAAGLLRRGAKIALELHIEDIKRYGSSSREVAKLLDFDAYEISAMARPDWETLFPVREVGDLPGEGVVNLFLKPRHRHDQEA